MSEHTIIINGDVTINGGVLEDAEVHGRVRMGPDATLRNCTISAPNYCGSQDDLVRALTKLNQQGRLTRLLRR